MLPTLTEFRVGFIDVLTLCSLQEPISEAAAVLICYPGICPVWSHGTVLFDGCFPYPVCYVKLLSYNTFITNVITYFIVATKIVPCWSHENVHFQIFQTLSKTNMYCTNVRNYMIKIHVFDYLILAVTLCLRYQATPTERSRLSWMSSSGSSCLDLTSVLFS